ncbi:acyl-CoA dehydrogenase family protein [Streptomyces sp. 8N706]|uniref:acyl-CoA dehydrogenase family protein n=1 Tax=Streptomyces sp. 8N706 TaxID=3457416 RepID=UPI003FD53902
MTDGDDRLVARARDVASRQLAPRADEVDTAGAFPSANIRALHEAGLMGALLPAWAGGQDASLTTFARVAAALGGACTSTAMLWAMHGQQVASLVDHAADAHGDWLKLAGDTGCPIGSVTTDRQCGADLLSTGPALEAEGDRFRLVREAPVVTGGRHAGFYLVTMRADPDSPPNRTRLVLVAHDDGVIEETGTWDALGMRGTHSVPMRFDVTVGASRVLATDFGVITRVSMVPVGHIGWASVWYGAAEGAFDRVRRAIREGRIAKGGRRSELLFARLAEVRLRLDLLESVILRAAEEADRARARFRADGQPVGPDPVLVNNVKLAGSQLAFEAVDSLVDIAGMAEGYRRGGALGLERTLRDLRSARLMFHDDRLKTVNGRLVLAPSLHLTGSRDPAPDRTAGEVAPE